MPSINSANNLTTAPEYTLSIVAPAYNEEQVLPEFHRRLVTVLDSLSADAEIVYINDGSTDNTLGVIQDLRAGDPRVALIDLSRNFGKEIALTAGIDHACGDALIVIDTDLQDPPELIPQLVQAWLEGHDVVYAKRTERQGETWLKKITARAFYRILQRMSRVKLPEDTGDYRLLSRRAADALRQLREQHRYMKGLFSWIGFRQKAVLYRREPRFAGQTKWNYWRLWNFALDGITSFTIVPLKIASYMGFILSFTAFLYGSWTIVKTLMFGDPVRGYPSLMTVLLFIGGIQLLFIGVIGEYLGRMFDESKRRPLYFLNSYEPSKHNHSSSIPQIFHSMADEFIEKQ